MISLDSYLKYNTIISIMADIILNIKVIPNAKKDKIGDKHGEYSKVYITAPPVKNKDNKHHKTIKKGRYIAVHRFVLEKKIGRYLTKGEIAHHINGDKSDNRPQNLELLTISEHNKQHAKSRKRKSNGKV